MKSLLQLHSKVALIESTEQNIYSELIELQIVDRKSTCLILICLEENHRKKSIDWRCLIIRVVNNIEVMLRIT